MTGYPGPAVTIAKRSEAVCVQNAVSERLMAARRASVAVITERDRLGRLGGGGFARNTDSARRDAVAA